MDTNRTLLKACCVASLALFASIAGAQTIYKQVDADGRVMFTDQPDPSARVVASYDTSRRARRPDSESDGPAAEPVRRPAAEIARAPTEESQRWPVADPMRRAPAEIEAQFVPAWVESARAAESEPSFAAVPDAKSGGPAQPSARRLTSDAERAASTYTPLDSPLAYQVDASEAARRAQQEMHRNATSSGVLVVKPLPREHEPAPRYEGFTGFYMMWVATFFLLAAGLLYVGWQVLRLILRSAFPRWQLGVG